MLVEAVSSKEVKTKFGPKPTYSAKMDDGEWYSFGFKNPGINKGDEVEFEYDVDRYGRKVKDGTIKIKGASPTAAASSAPTTPRTFGPPAKPFPIPLLHGDRAIIRQNSVTNAVKLVTDLYKTGELEEKEIVDAVIRIARELEAYSAGDIERLNAEKEPK